MVFCIHIGLGVEAWSANFLFVSGGGRGLQLKLILFISLAFCELLRWPLRNRSTIVHFLKSNCRKIQATREMHRFCQTWFAALNPVYVCTYWVTTTMCHWYLVSFSRRFPAGCSCSSKQSAKLRALWWEGSTYHVVQLMVSSQYWSCRHLSKYQPSIVWGIHIMGKFHNAAGM